MLLNYGKQNMCINRTVLLSYSATSLFVLLWSSGAIFSKLGLESASAFAFLLLRFALALIILLIISVPAIRALSTDRSHSKQAIIYRAVLACHGDIDSGDTVDVQVDSGW